MTDAEPSPIRQQLRWLVGAGIILIVLSFVAGYCFSTLSGPRAARRVVGDRVERTETPTEAAAEPLCGIATQPVPEAVRAATLAEGGVVVTYRPGAASDAQVREVAEQYASHLLVAPAPQQGPAVVAVAPGHRLELDAWDPSLVRAFAAGYGDPVGEPASCPVEAGG